MEKLYPTGETGNEPELRAALKRHDADTWGQLRDQQTVGHDADVELRALLADFYADTWALARAQQNPTRRPA